MGQQAARRGGGIPWSLITCGGDMALCLGAVSAAAPESAEVVVLGEAPLSRGGARLSRVVLCLRTRRGRRRLALDAASPACERRLEAAAGGSLVVVEEDALAPGGRRFAYVAGVRAGAAP